MINYIFHYAYGKLHFQLYFLKIFKMASGIHLDLKGNTQKEIFQCNYHIS